MEGGEDKKQFIGMTTEKFVNVENYRTKWCHPSYLKEEISLHDRSIPIIMYYTIST